MKVENEKAAQAGLMVTPSHESKTCLGKAGGDPTLFSQLSSSASRFQHTWQQMQVQQAETLEHTALEQQMLEKPALGKQVEIPRSLTT